MCRSCRWCFAVVDRNVCWFEPLDRDVLWLFVIKLEFVNDVADTLEHFVRISVRWLKRSPDVVAANEDMRASVQLLVAEWSGPDVLCRRRRSQRSHPLAVLFYELEMLVVYVSVHEKLTR